MANEQTCCARDDDPLRSLTESAVVRESLAEFRRLTGSAAKLVPAAIPDEGIPFGSEQNEFCCRVSSLSGGCPACHRMQEELLRRVGAKLEPQRAGCPAGMIHFAVPVMVAGRHGATVIGGKVLSSPANEAGFERVSRPLRHRITEDQLGELREAYLHAPVLTHAQLDAALRLLHLLAQLFVRAIAHQPAPCSDGEPPCIAEAKQLVRLHLNERVSTRQTAGALHLTESYFCRLFHRVTGMTFHEYVAEVRVEQAKALLLNSSRSVGDIAFAAGFQTLSGFNHVFKAKTGMTPSQFRRTRQTPANADKERRPK